MKAALSILLCCSLSAQTVTFSTGNAAFDRASSWLFSPMPTAAANSYPFYETSAAYMLGTVLNPNFDSFYSASWNTPGPGTITVAQGSYSIVGNGSTTFKATFCNGGTSPADHAGIIVWYPLLDGSNGFGRRLAGYPTNTGGTTAWITGCADDQHMTLATNPWQSSEATGTLSGLQYSVWDNSSAFGFSDRPVNYYDSSVAANYAEWLRTGTTAYLTAARHQADVIWKSPWYDHGNAFDLDYASLNQGLSSEFRSWSMEGLVLRALDTADGQPDMWAGLHKVWGFEKIHYLDNFPKGVGFGEDTRDGGLAMAQLSYCAMFDTDSTWAANCRLWLKQSFMASGTGARNIWPARQDPITKGWPIFWTSGGGYGPTNGTGKTVSVVFGSKNVVCDNGACGFTSSNFAAPPANGYGQAPNWFVVSRGTTFPGIPGDNSEFESTPYCYTPGGASQLANCTFIDSNHFTLDRPYDGDASCTALAPCHRSWVVGGAGPAGWGQEPFFAGILGVGFEMAGKALTCTSTGVPTNCDNTIAAVAFGFASDNAKWMMQYGYRATAHGSYYYAGMPGCVPPISENNAMCLGGTDYISSREYAMDGFRGLMMYYFRTSDSSAKTILDDWFSCMWAKPGTGAALACGDATTSYDSSFAIPGGVWSNNGSLNVTNNKLIGQNFGWGGQFSYPAALPPPPPMPPTAPVTLTLIVR